MNPPLTRDKGRAVVVNKHREGFDVYIGRGSEWGNPHHVDDVGREQAIELYRQDLWARIRDEGYPLINRLAQLRGRRLGCYCAPKPCHGDVLVEAAEWAARENEQAVFAEMRRLWNVRL